MTDFIIAGAGIGGLSVAIALQKAGFSAKVYEVAPQLLPLGAGLSLSGNAIKAYDQIGLKDKVLAIGHKAKSGQLLTPKGKILSQFSLSISEEKYNYPAVAVHRGELQSLLVKELAPDSLFLGRKAFFFDQDVHAVTLNFIEGEPVKGAFLIDATGVNSYLRHEFHYHSKPRYSGYTCWRGVCDYKMEAHRDMLVTETWG
ncbi:MAG: FAD-dependent monooxygenase, partial [Chitinophagales bacterium]